MADQYDVLILGSGQAGNPLSSDFVKAGRRVALVERAEVAGTCINYGCTPTKTMVASAQRAWQARHAREFGIDIGAVRVDMKQVRARKRKIVEQFRTSSEKRFAGGQLELVRGEARFVTPKEIVVALKVGGERRMTADTIVIDTGDSPTVPKIGGLAGVPYLDNVSLMELDAVPEHLLILGGGYEAVEFGQMFRRFGSEVTLIERGKHLLGHEDVEISEAVETILREDGVRIETGAKAARVDGEPGAITVHLEHGKSISSSHLFIAVGRSPNTKELNLDAAGVEKDEHGYVKVDEELRTNVPGIYAVGDVKGGPAFTHVSYDDYRILRDNLITGKGGRKTTDRMTVYVVYMDPQLGRVGMTEAEARQSGRRIKVARMPVTSIARATETGESRGLLKAVVDAETEQILGAAILAPEGGELMSMFELAMMGNLRYSALEDAVFAHPAYAESLNTLWGHFEK
ncbi:MAG TPA: mercuric reductase [Acidobacteriaceae bacterium]|jgi:pyruvate/2-oxoglutarate dehydrogenase complex dihydrolipoamide dehydrogenase (E3) component